MMRQRGSKTEYMTRNTDLQNKTGNAQRCRLKGERENTGEHGGEHTHEGMGKHRTKGGEGGGGRHPGQLHRGRLLNN